MSNPILRPAALAVAGLLTLSAPARSQTTPQATTPHTMPPSAGPSSPWSISLGFGAGAAPAYEGSAHYKFEPLPYASIKYRDLLSIGTGGVRLSAFNRNGFTVGPMLGFFGGRSHTDDRLLNHVGGIPASLTGGAFARYEVNRLSFEADLQEALSRSKSGLRGRLAASWRQPIVAQRLWAEVGPALVFADGRYETAYFGITADQSRRSGLRAFKPGGGLQSAGLDTSLSWRQSEHVVLRGMADVHRIVGSAADSPLVRSKTQLFVGLGAAYQF